MVDKFARMSLTTPKTEVLHDLRKEGINKASTDAKPYKKKSPSIPSHVAAACANTVRLFFINTFNCSFVLHHSSQHGNVIFPGKR